MADKRHVMPWWMGYLLINPLRKFLENPDRIFAPFVKPGMKVLEIGPAMGFFTLPLGRLVGEKGKVISVEIQERMIKTLEKRVRKAGLEDIIEVRPCSGESLLIETFKNQIDFAVAFHVVHEVSGAEKMFREIYETIRPGALLFVAEPKGHVTEDELKNEIETAKECGFKLLNRPDIKRNRSFMLQK